MTPQPLELEARPSDAELLEATAAGSEAAFAELRGRYRGAVGRICSTIAGPDREDCEQEVFARIWRKAPLYDRRRGSAAGWLLTVARHTALSTHGGRRPPTPVDEATVYAWPSIVIVHGLIFSCCARSAISLSSPYS